MQFSQGRESHIRPLWKACLKLSPPYPIHCCCCCLKQNKVACVRVDSIFVWSKINIRISITVLLKISRTHVTLGRDGVGKCLGSVLYKSLALESSSRILFTVLYPFLWGNYGNWYRGFDSWILIAPENLPKI